VDTVAEIQAEHVLLAAAVILGAGSILGYLSRRLTFPDIVFFLVGGILLGPECLGIVDIRATSTLSWIIVIFSASYILFDGGATLQLRVLSSVWISLTTIVTVGVVATALIVGFAASSILGIPIKVGLLLGAALASTDPASLVPLLKQTPVNPKVSQFVISESALNDPVGAILTYGLLSSLVIGHGATHLSLSKAAVDLVAQALIGTCVGAVLGYLTSFLVSHKRYGVLAEYLPMVTLISVIGSYLSASGLHSSGFMASFVAGLMMGNARAPGLATTAREHASFADFVSTTSLISRMFIFMLLGSQMNLELMFRYWRQGLALVAVFMLIARPITVAVSTLADRRARWNWRELVFIAWTRETGVIPGALASIMIAAHAPHADVLAAMIFIAIIITIIVQATTAKWLAGRLHLLIEDSHN